MESEDKRVWVYDWKHGWEYESRWEEQYIEDRADFSQRKTGQEKRCCDWWTHWQTLKRSPSEVLSSISPGKNLEWT